MKKVLMAMSGGIDSTASAVILLEQGHDVTGMTFFNRGTDGNAVQKAKDICAALKIPHVAMDTTDVFKHHVIEYFKSEYEHGRTPNPCIQCNRTIKFGHIYEYAEKSGYDAVATGHYARISQDNGVFFLGEAKDASKDQTYFLYVLKEPQLPRILFPLGDLDKVTARRICDDRRLLPAQSKESQEICFIRGDYRDFLLSLGANNRLGNFIDENGNVLGPHRGLIHYTIGQRKGLGISLGKRVFVKEIRRESGEIVLSGDDTLMTRELMIKNISLIHEFIPPDTQLYAKIRYGTAKDKVTVHPDGEGMRMFFEENQRAVTPGQSVVLYTGSRVVGGGIIDQSTNQG
ncbi:MAG: tRNA 2-thiouridine(34) synthase MnmA [Clostridia bacterium]